MSGCKWYQDSIGLFLIFGLFQVFAASLVQIIEYFDTAIIYRFIEDEDDLRTQSSGFKLNCSLCTWKILIWILLTSTFSRSLRPLKQLNQIYIIPCSV